ncbi:amino acid permease [Egbenema bharatensis]|uniref:amino acid permease n=1 Tax=Egbenema bharatensis TaxID=3463334 RepID=UPI003A847608
MSQQQQQQQQREQQEQQQQGLVREMGLFNALAIGLGTMLGAGIFVLSGTAAQEAGPAAAVSFAIAGLICLPISMTVSELVTAMPQEGGSYYLISRTLGALAATIVGPANWLGLMFATGFYLIGFAEYVTDFVAIPTWTSEVGAGLLFIFLNYRGAKLSGMAQTVIVAILVVILVSFAGFGFFNIEPELHEPFAPFGWGAAFGTVGLIIVSFTGFEKVSTVAEEIKKPGRNLPWAIIGSVVFATIIYAAVVYVMTGVISYEALENDFDPPLIEAAEQFAGNIGGVVIGIGALLATASSANAAILASSRINFAMGRDRVLPGWFGEIHPRHMTPTHAILFTGGLAILLALSDQAPTLAEISSALFMISYALLTAGLIVARRSAPEWYQPAFRVPLYPWLPLLGGIAAVVVIGTLDRFSQLSGLGLAAVSLLWYYFWARKRTTISGELRGWLRREHPIRSTLNRVDIVQGNQFNDILVAIGDAETGKRLINLATALAQGRRETKITALKIVKVPYNLPLSEGQKRLDQTMRHQYTLEESIQAANGRGVEIQTQIQGAREVSSAIVEITRHQPTTHLVLLGWPGSDAQQGMKNRIDRAVLNNASCDVAVLRNRQLDRIQRILVAIEDSPHARTGLHLAHYLQSGTEAEVVALHIAENQKVKIDAVENRIQTLVEQEFAETSDRVSVQVVQADSVVKGIVTEAKQDYDLVIMGASKRWFLQRWLFSGNSDQVAEKAPCSVLLVRQHEPRSLLLLERTIAHLRGV